MSTLRESRLALDKGLRTFAMEIGLLPSDYCKIENGQQPPTAEQTAAICRGLGTTELPHIPLYVKPAGPLIPLHIRKMDGEPATPQDYEDMYKFLNEPEEGGN